VTRRNALLATALALAATAPACAPTPAPSPALASSPAPAPAPTVSDPDEYQDHGISASAGEAYFARLGGGDPYATGLAYPVWLALIEGFPAEMGGDLTRFAQKFGLLVDGPPGALPVGFHLTTDPNTRVPFVVMNCQLCHAERLHLPAGDRIVSGLGSTHVRAHAYDAAFVHIARDPAFSTESVLLLANKAAREHELPWPEATRVAIVRATVSALRERAEARGADVERFAAGLPGRVATIESFALALGAHGTHVPLGPTVGWAKVPDVRGFPWRDTLSFDGVGTGNPVALAAEADFAFGARPQWFETHRHIATSLYMFLKHFDRDLLYPASIDAALAERGHSAFDATCARCHGFYAPPGPQPRLRYRERVIPAAMIGTDPAREEAVTPAFVAAANSVPLARGVSTVAATGGYVPPVLLDVWARGTYGHIGQWPSIEVMAMKPDERPRRFAVDPDAPYDLGKLGSKWTPLREGEKPGNGYAYDGTLPGYGVEGHRFLSDLPADERRAVMEYLKTL
jgi:mono/diheme cytochrome c family protein